MKYKLLWYNTWGYSFVGGYPKGGVVSKAAYGGAAHAGGLVDGPIDREWHQTCIAIRQLTPSEDPLAVFNNGPAVFYMHSYGTNEPVIDGTCYLIYHLSIIEQRGKEQAKELSKK